MEYKISAKEISEMLDTARIGSTGAAIEAFWKLGLLKIKEASPIIKTRIKDKDPRVRLVCVEQITAILGKTAVNHLVNSLKDKIIEIGMAAASQLACLGTREAAEALIYAARSADPIVMTHGAYGMMYWDSLEGAKLLLAAMLDPDFDYRGDAALALGRIGDKSALPALTRAFARSTDESEKIQVATAITMLGGEDQQEVIREGLFSQSYRTKLTTLSCLQAVWDKAAFTDIVPLIMDTDLEVKMEAVRTLEEMGLFQKEKYQVTIAELAKNAIRRSLPEGYSLDASD